MILLKQSTAVDLVVGPFVDDTDGKTAETGLTLSQADCQLTKNGGAMAQKNDSTSATHLGGGHYKVPLNTTDTNTLGVLRLYINESGALPVWMDCMVMPANAWDALFGSDKLQVDVVEISGDSAAADNLESYCDGTTPIPANATQIEGSDATDQINAACDTAISDAALATAANLATVDTVVDAILEDTAVIGAAGAGLTAVPWNAAWDAEVQSECADALTAYDPPTKAELDSGFAGLNDLSAAEVNAEVDTALADYDAPTKAEMDSAFSTTNGKIDAVDDFVDTEVAAIKAVTDKLDTALELDVDVYRFTENALEEAPTGGSAPTAGEIADAVWDEATSGHTTGGTFGEQLKIDVDAILEDTAVIGAAGAGLTAVPWNAAWDAEVQSECADALNTYDPPTKAEMDSGFAGLNDLSAAEVNAEVDTALADYDAPTKAEMDAGFAALNDLSAAEVNAEVDTALADYDAPTKAELDAGFAGLNDLSAAEVNAEVDTALADYDAPTKAEMDAGFAALNDLSAAEVNAEVDTALADYDGPTKAEMDAGFAALNDLSAAEVNAEVDTALADYDGPTKAELDAGFAALNDLSAAEVNAEVDTALADYDGPTKAEMDAGFAGLNDLSAAEVNAEVDTALADYDAPTKAEMDAGFAGLNDLSAAEVNAEVDTALADYDGPTKAELDAAVASLATSAALATVDANVDSLITSMAKVLGLSHENIYIDTTVYDTDGNLTSARIRIYSDPASVGTSDDVIATYTITAVCTALGKFTSWKQVTS